MTAEALMRVSSLRAGYGRKPILLGVDLAVRQGEIAAVIGRNGVGKTTLMRCLIGLVRATEGRIDYRGEDVTSASADQRAQRGMGYIPQGREVFPNLTVDENLGIGELIGGAGRRKLRDAVYEFFPILRERRRQRAGTLSGGQQQQLAIGRALIGNPDLMLLDEPSEGVQPSIVHDICRIIKQINRDMGTTILFVEQNMDVILSMAQRCYVMDKGTIKAELASDALEGPEIVREHLRI